MDNIKIFEGLDIGDSFATTSSIYNSIKFNYEKTFYVKGQEILVKNSDNSSALIFSMISLLGYEAYETFEENGVVFDEDIKRQLKVIFRDDKIKNILSK